MPCRECSNYRSSGLGVKPEQWRASVRVLNPAKAEEQYQTADSTVRPLWPHKCGTDSEARITATKKNCHYLSSFPLRGLNSHSQETTMPCHIYVYNMSRKTNTILGCSEFFCQYQPVMILEISDAVRTQLEDFSGSPHNVLHCFQLLLLRKVVEWTFHSYQSCQLYHR